MRDFNTALQQWLTDFHTAVHLKTPELAHLLMGQTADKVKSHSEHLPMLVDEVMRQYRQKVRDDGASPGFETLLSVVQPQSFATHMVRDDPGKFCLVKDIGQNVIQDLISVIRKQLISCEEVVDAVLYPVEDDYVQSLTSDESMSVLLNAVTHDTAYFDKPYPVAAIHRFNVK